LNLYREVKNPENWRQRAFDVSMAIDRMVARPNVDATRIAVVGHSAGAWTAYAMAGLKNVKRESLADPRVKVIVPMSMPRMVGVVPPDGYDDVTIPVLNITGTCDSSLIYRTFPKHRRIPFDRTPGPHKYLVTIERVNHDTFSALTDRFHPLISKLTIDFLRAYLDGHDASRAFFDEPGLMQAGDARFALEVK
jgi:predicted dienelactone hydrolase